MASARDGLRADDVAAALGKSTSTAYNLLDTLCDAGYAWHSDRGTYHLTADAAGLVPRTTDAAVPAGLEGILDELFARTHKRVYLAAARSGRVIIPLARGRQGMPRIPGLGAHIGENAHALSLGKVALSLLDDPAVDRYLARGLRRFTRHTITCEDRLRTQISDIRAGEVAHEREEFAEDFCCLAVPVIGARGNAVAALGISMSARCFELESASLSRVLQEVAERAAVVLGRPDVPAISEDHDVLERPTRAHLKSASAAVGSTVTTGEEL